jgi:hypothetical protein
MTPEEIVKDFIDKMALLEDDNDIGTMVKAKDQAIEAIKHYAKQMCDKQRYNCNENLEVETIDSHGQDTCYVNSDSVLNAPYPSELQD